MRGVTRSAPAPTMSGKMNVNGLSRPPVSPTSPDANASARTTWSGPCARRSGVLGRTSWRSSSASPVTATRITIWGSDRFHSPLAAAKTATAIRKAQLTIRMIRASSVGSGAAAPNAIAGSGVASSSAAARVDTVSSRVMALGSSVASVFASLSGSLARKNRRRTHTNVGASSSANAMIERIAMVARTISDVVGINESRTGTSV